MRCVTTRGCWHLREYRIISEALARGTITMLTDIPKEPLSERPLDIELERPSDIELERRSETLEYRQYFSNRMEERYWCLV